MNKPSVIIIREENELVAACCVPFEGEFIKEVGKVDLFLNTTEILKSTGDLYNKLRKDYGDHIKLDIVDPRNLIYLIPRLIKDIFKYKVSLWQALKTIFLLQSPSVVCNGRLVVSGKNKLSNQTINQIHELVS